MRFFSVALASALMLTGNAQADTVSIPFNGMTLNAELEIAEDKTLADGVLLLTHGTLAHNKMELIATLQELLVDAGISTLAINLSLGVDNRESAMYDCTIPARHHMEDAITEIEAWQQWLDTEGAGPRWLMGHSRGGNQTAQYTLAYPQRVAGQILLAPATWDYNATLSGYAENYGEDIGALLKQAATLPPDALLTDASILYCQGSGASASALLSYYANNPAYDTPTVLKETQTPTLVIAGTLDQVVSDLPEKMAEVTTDNIEFIEIQDADHFFRDLYADEVTEYAVEFIETL